MNYTLLLEWGVFQHLQENKRQRGTLVNGQRRIVKLPGRIGKLPRRIVQLGL